MHIPSTDLWNGNSRDGIAWKRQLMKRNKYVCEPDSLKYNAFIKTLPICQGKSYLSARKPDTRLPARPPAAWTENWYVASSTLQSSRSLMSSKVGGLTLSEAEEVKNVIQSRTVLLSKLQYNYQFLMSHLTSIVNAMDRIHQSEAYLYLRIRK